MDAETRDGERFRAALQKKAIELGATPQKPLPDEVFADVFTEVLGGFSKDAVANILRYLHREGVATPLDDAAMREIRRSAERN